MRPARERAAPPSSCSLRWKARILPRNALSYTIVRVSIRDILEFIRREVQFSPRSAEASGAFTAERTRRAASRRLETASICTRCVDNVRFLCFAQSILIDDCGRSRDHYSRFLVDLLAPSLLDAGVISRPPARTTQHRGGNDDRPEQRRCACGRRTCRSASPQGAGERRRGAPVRRRHRGRVHGRPHGRSRDVRDPTRGEPQDRRTKFSAVDSRMGVEFYVGQIALYNARQGISRRSNALL